MGVCDPGPKERQLAGSLWNHLLGHNRDDATRTGGPKWEEDKEPLRLLD